MEYKDFQNGCGECESGFIIVYDSVPYGCGNVLMPSTGDETCGCKFGRIREVMNQLELHFDIETYDNEKLEEKLFNVAVNLMEVLGESGKKINKMWFGE